jgi:hypothetical protein
MTAVSAKQDSGKRRLPTVEPKRWNYRAWGSLTDPIHKSHLSSLIGPYACLESFRRDRQREVEQQPDRETCSGKTEMGTAIHEAIARALRQPTVRDTILAGRPAVSRDSIRPVIVAEFERACAGRAVTWYGKAEYPDALEDGVSMVLGLFQDMHKHVRAVELVEAGWIAKLGDLWLEGHIDLVYRPRDLPDDALAFVDWKSGAQKPHQISLDHGYESGFYSLALERGYFVPTQLLDVWRMAANEVEQTGSTTHALPSFDPWDLTALRTASSDRAAMHVALRAIARKAEAGLPLPAGVRVFGKFPEVIRLAHLADYVPYEKKGDKAVTRPEDLAHWSRVLGRELRAGEKVKYESGQQRGGAWLEVRRTVHDVVRLERALRAVVGWVRFGKFVAAVGELCTRCSYRGPCLTDGYQLDADASKDLNAALRGVDLGATDALGDEP